MKKWWLLILLFLIKPTLAAFPTPVSASYYPIYNDGIGQYMTPNVTMPFDKISLLFIAFAHTYPKENGAVLALEDTQPDEMNRLPLLVKTARQANPKIKLLISLG